MASRFYVVSGRVPFLCVDEDGEPAVFESEDAANEAALRTSVCQALGYVVIECDDNGVVGACD